MKLFTREKIFQSGWWLYPVVHGMKIWVNRCVDKNEILHTNSFSNNEKRERNVIKFDFEQLYREEKIFQSMALSCRQSSHENLG